MILQRALAAHLVAVSPGLHAFKDDLAWVQAGEPWPLLLITATGTRRQSIGTGTYDTREWSAATEEWVYAKAWIYAVQLRLTIRGVAADDRSAATVVDDVARAIEAELRRYGTGQRLELLDAISGETVRVRRILHRGASDQGPILERVPFQAQRTLDYEFQWVQTTEVGRAGAFETINLTEE